MIEGNQLAEHLAFVIRSDRKSLYTQIKNLVHQAQDVARKELNQRRHSLKNLLEYEDIIYEEEFANTVKSRIDKDIRDRKENLLKLKQENTNNELKFLKSKRIQQYMNSCYEIREALRHKETQNIKECQLEQILEKERAIKRERDLEKYWLKVQEVNLEVMDKRQKEEDCVKKALVKHVSDVRKVQLEQLAEKREEICKQKLEEKRQLDALLEELRIEKFDKVIKGKPAKAVEYGQELLRMAQEKREKEAKAKQEEAESHREMMRGLEGWEAKERAEFKEKQKAFYKATMDYIKFVKGVRELGEQQEQMYASRIDELGLIDRCTKRNILRERERKARIAEQCYADLRKQICEQYQMRLKDEAEYRENKMLENRFARKEITRDEIRANRVKFREELDKQIEKLKKIREAEDAQFSNDLKRASNDPEFCSELAKVYIQEGIDYLEPHANWRTLTCPRYEYVPKPPARSEGEQLCQGAVPRKCFEPCGCLPHVSRKNADGRGDENIF